MNTVLLIGYGVEGQAAARHFLAQTDDRVLVLDPVHAPGTDHPRLVPCNEASALEALGTARLHLRSPGVPPDHPVLRAAAKAGVTFTTPTGFWLSTQAPAQTITVTGTKGKSSTVALTAFLLEAAGLPAIALGNIGAPPLDAAPITATHAVIELSSYMMHDLPIGPYTHIVTNLYREHTPWHGTEAAYRAAKLRPFRHVPPAPGFTLRPIIAEERLPAAVRAIEDVADVAAGALQFAGKAWDVAATNPLFASLPQMLALRAAVAAASTQLALPALTGALAQLDEYRGLPSRQEIVPSTDGRLWVNDALATIPEAVMAALARFAGQRVYVLLGGADRQQDWARLAAALAQMSHVHPIIFGSTAPALADALHRTHTAFSRAASFEAAIDAAMAAASHEAVILFSPGAASEPPHRDYQARARIFRDAAAQG